MEQLLLIGSSWPVFLFDNYGTSNNTNGSENMGEESRDEVAQNNSPSPLSLDPAANDVQDESQRPSEQLCN